MAQCKEIEAEPAVPIEAVEPSIVPFVTKRAMKKARAEAERQMAAEQEAYRLQRKEAKKERRQADAAAKALAEAAARQAAWARPHATRIQCAVRCKLARSQRAMLHRRKVQHACFAAMRLWRQLMIRVLRGVMGWRLLLSAAARTAALKQQEPSSALAEVPRSRPNSLRMALQEGHWTRIRDSNHNVFKRKVMTAAGEARDSQTELKMGGSGVCNDALATARLSSRG